MKKNREHEPIAIVGIGCRMPGGASSPAKLWNLLKQGFNGIVDVPPDRWDMRRFYDADPSLQGKMYVNKGGFLQEKIDEFDAAFFHITPREANSLDPQQRLLLESAWEAFEDGGIVPSNLRGSRTGVFIGAFTTDWQNLNNNPFNLMYGGAYTGINSSQTILSARLAYFFDFKGPCLTIDTACSSSLAAVHCASQSLWQQECEMALAGGVNVMLTPEATIAMSKGQFLNPEGYCRSFDANAKGYVRGEGAGIVILKPLSTALRDRDPIYALIKATGINHDGQGSGLTVPNKEAQKQLIRHVIGEAQICPSQIQYMEAHGTGTSIGDPIEVWAIDQVLNCSERKHKCLLGSIKTNIGHLEAAAGIVGLIKTALCLKHRHIPPNLHFTKPNPAIAYDKICLEIPTQCRDFPNPNSFIYAGVNSFGYGGTNVHAVLQANPLEKETTGGTLSKPFPFPFSAKNPDSLLAQTNQMSTYLQENPSISMADLAYTLCLRRDHHPQRINVLAQTSSELMSKLKQGTSQSKALSEPPKIAFVFTGMGPQRHRMGMELYQRDHVFQAVLNQCDQLLRPLTGWSLLEELSQEKQSSQMDQPEFSQPANFAIQAALFETLKSKGIHPDEVVGHSIGEIGAAYAAGAITLEAGLYISHHRSRIQASRKGLGTMLAAEMSLENAEVYTSKFPDSLSIAAINSNSYLTFSGDEKILQCIASELDQKNVFHRFLKVNIAYHSYQMDGLEEEVFQSLQNISSQRPYIPLYSTALGRKATDIDLDAAYWWQNIRNPVLFEKALSEMHAQVFIELGPHPVLTKHILESHPQCIALHTLHRQESEETAIEILLGKLYVNGCSIPWHLQQPLGSKCISLPGYPWKKERYWNESEESRQYRCSLQGHPMLARRCNDPDEAWTVEVNRYFFSWLEDHKLDSSIVFPAAAYVEAGIALFMQKQGTTACVLENLEFIHPLVIQSGKEPLLKITSNSVHFTIHSGLKDSFEWILHAKGSIKPLWRGYIPQPLDLKGIQSRMNFVISPKDLYRQFANKGMEYGPSFQLIQKLYCTPGEALAEIHIPNNFQGHYLPPPILDNALQSLIATVNAGESQSLILPVHIDEIHVFNIPQERLWCYSKGRLLKNQFKGDMLLCDALGNICIEIRGAICQVMENRDYAYSEKLFYHIKWKEILQLQVPCSFSKQFWCIISPHSTKLAQQLEELGAKCHLDIPENISHIQNLHVVFDCAPLPHETCIDNELRVSKELLQLVQHLDGHCHNPYTLWMITYYHSTPWGFARTLRNENPQCTYRVIDIPKIDDFIHVLSLQPQEDEIKYHSGKCYAPQLTPGLDFEYPPKVIPITLHTSHACVELELTKPGSISNLYYRQSHRRDPQSGEVEVQVHTASLNFKDLMKVMGLLEPKALEGTYFGLHFGMEASGTIVKVGKGVRNYKVGDPVCVFIGNAFRSFITLSTDFISPIPIPGDLTQAPIYIPYITVLHCLKSLAKLSKGETILIHSATGAVGQAAIQYAKHVKSNIIATAGNPEKRQFLNSLGIDLVADSRSLQFSSQVMEWTNGRGVDVVLNALSGDFLVKSWSLLATGGRFIEIGKQDIVRNALLPMETFNRNTLFAAVDLDRIFLNHPKIIHSLLKQAKHCFQKGIFKPPPCSIFPAAQCHAAFQMMAKGQHIGKILLKMADETLEVMPKIEPKPLFDADSTYMITGGLSGFGLATTKWIAKQGGRHLLLLSRNGPTTAEAHKTLKEFEEKQIHVKIARVDVGHFEQLSTILKEYLPLMPPLKGIFHSAMVLEDALVTNMQPEQIVKVLHPKMCGCWNLHRLTCEAQLDYFVLFSSISSLIGNPGQANYAAANAFLDHFVDYRTKLGLPALTLNWGAIADVGVAARNAQLMAHLKASGIHPLFPQQALNNLEILLPHSQGQYAIMHVDWPKIFSALPKLRNQTFFELVKVNQNLSQDSDILHQLKQLDIHAQKQALVALIKEKIAGIMQMDIHKIDENVKLNTLGVDSLMAMELQHVMEQQLGFKIPTMELIKGPTIIQLAHTIQNR